MNLFHAGIFTIAVLAAPACTPTKTDSPAENATPKCGEAGATAADCPKVEAGVAPTVAPEVAPTVAPEVAPEVLAATEVVTLSAKRITRDAAAGTVTLEANTAVQQATYVTWIFDGASYDAVVGDKLQEDSGLDVKVLLVLTETKVVVPAEGMPAPSGGFHYVTNHGKVLALAP